MTYYGSFVGLDTPRHTNGNWVYGGLFYTALVSDWDYNTDFNDESNLPPLSTRFVFMRQDFSCATSSNSRQMQHRERLPFIAPLPTTVTVSFRLGSCELVSE